MSSSEKHIVTSLTKRFSIDKCTPVNWSKYFENQHEVPVKGNVFNVYSRGKSGPVLLLIHGGGYSGLTWSLCSKEITNKIECRILAIDLRGHGGTQSNDELNLSLDVLLGDLVDLVTSLFEKLPPLVLIGHSLGGALATAAASTIPSVIGLCVIDVVEGSALKALTSMQNFLRNRPSSFRSIEDAIQWCVKSGQTHNLEAARVSMPGQIKNLKTGQLAANKSVAQVVKELDKPQAGSFSTIQEIDDQEFKTPLVKTYVWRTDLSKTEPFWQGWFKGLSQKFLDVQVPKVLLLANIHGLDTTLTVGQMQGKFQLQVLPKSGHVIHEDQPCYVADVIAGFLVKQKLAAPKNGFSSNV